MNDECTWTTQMSRFVVYDSPEQKQTVAWLQHVDPRKRKAAMIFTPNGPMFVPISMVF